MVPCIFPKGIDQLRKRFDLVLRPCKLRILPDVLQNLIEADALLACRSSRTVDRCFPDAALWNVDDPLRADVIPSVVNGSKITEDIPHLHAVIEIMSADDVVGNALHDKLIFQKTRLGIGPVQDGEVLVGKSSIPAKPSSDVLRNEGRFVCTACKLAEMNPAALAVIGPELFLLARGVVRNHRIRCVQNILRRPVILLQPNHIGIRIDLLKIQNIPDIRSAEFVNRLIVVSHDAEISGACCQHPHNFELRLVGILVLIHHDVAEPVLVIPKNILSGRKQLHRLHQKIVKIQCVIGDKLLFILRIYLSDPLFLETGGMRFLKTMCILQIIFRLRNRRHDGTLPELLGVDVHSPADLSDQCLLIIRIIDGKITVVSDLINMSSQDAHAHRVKGRNPDALRAKADQLVHTLPHLACRLVGEGDRQYIPGIYAAFLHQVGYPVGNHSCFAASCPRKDQHRALRVKAGISLLFV